MNYHSPLPRDNATTVEKAINKIRLDTIENLYVFRNGKQVARYRGDSKNISPDPANFICQNNDTWVHNHPTGNSFSEADIENMVSHNVKEFYLATEYALYRVKRPGNTWPFDPRNSEVNDVLKSCEIIAEESFGKSIQQNELSRDEANALKMHYIWSLFFDFYGIQYTQKQLG
ncbi:hypothetical protein LAG90_10275 [Marinilongibacter aquaticus]|uniref:hypothetical protein n=1 Tax=Marinilongibacter aquaticus TaxID=2975157 RepID=UPI0021BD31FF|nr:hypothetical protein [Marinilongibacter aquaticus]UBM57206.1 hypothetical protein LAG90_10275 [Marinilongibacter aquaticus]